MFDPDAFITHWGYLAIFIFVLLGNLGVPVPEETVLLLAGYLVWEGRLSLPIVLAVGITSAAVGDNLGYWLGRHYGQRAVERYGAWLIGRPKRLEAMRRIVLRWGPLSVFAARFVPGLRFAAGPLAGAMGMAFVPFTIANVLGGALFVPLVVAAGYGVGFGLGDLLRPFRRLVGGIEYPVLAFVIVSTVLLLAWRALRAALAQHRAPRGSSRT